MVRCYRTDGLLLKGCSLIFLPANTQPLWLSTLVCFWCGGCQWCRESWRRTFCQQQHTVRHHGWTLYTTPRVQTVVRHDGKHLRCIVSYLSVVLPLITWCEWSAGYLLHHMHTGSHFHLLLSAFSHLEIWHLALNMLVLWSFAPTFLCKYTGTM